jgi:hypothetical protein
VQLGDDAGVVVEVLGRPPRESLHLGDRHPDVAYLEVDEVGGALAHELGDAAQGRGPLARRKPRPRALVERRPRRRDRGVDVGGLTVARLGEDLVGGRVQRGEAATADALAKRAVDVVALQRELGRGIRRHGGADHIGFLIG